MKNANTILLAYGGGSAMDCCKAVSLAARYDGDGWEDFWARPGVIDFEPLPLGVVVTVAGTGSECNGGAVITNEEKKIKTGRDYPALNPRFAHHSGELGARKEQLKEIADSCGISQGSYKPMTHEEILEIFQECYE